MSSTVFIYGLLDPISRECRYVGKSKNPTVRRYQHVCDSQRAPKTHRNHWIKSLKAQGLYPELLSLEEVSAEDWKDAECFWISYMKFLGAKLTNGTSGGDGLHEPSAETREKIGASSRGKKRVFSPEHRAKVTAACRARAKDPVWLAKARENLAKHRHLGGNKGWKRIITPEWLEKARASMNHARQFRYAQ